VALRILREKISREVRKEIREAAQSRWMNGSVVE